MRIANMVLVLTTGSSVMATATCPVPPTSVESSAAQALAVNTLNQFLKCDPAELLNDRSPCNTFAGRGLEAIFGISDFKTDGGYMSANEIADFVAKSDKWASLGTVFNEDNNLCAQAVANDATPVIAVMKGQPHGHVALVIPGPPKNSPTWQFLVVNSASFFYGAPNSGYVSQPISKAFRPENAKNAAFYYRKPSLPGT